MQLSELRGRQKDLIPALLAKADLSLLGSNLPFSYLGARVCYAETHPLALFTEEKFQDRSKFTSFLLHLKKIGHFSVFAHTPIVVDLKEFSPKEKYELARTYFKSFFDEERGLALFTLRHFAENLDATEFLKLISVEIDLSKIKVRIFKREGGDWPSLWEGTLATALNLSFPKTAGFFTHPEVILLEDKINPFQWVSVIAHNFSRIFSHQFVRHTWLNFNQRSHRYTQADYFIIPTAFKGNQIEAYKSMIEQTMRIYREWSKVMKREVARFILPQGISTTVLASAPKFVWEDFLEKRTVPQAQEEIRELAILLKGVLY